jgi:pyruvate dehydrogenase E2 component (dihydrolipoamide acetyltransferase)
MPNVELTPLELSTWRKIALGSWGHGGDPSVYGILELNATKILERQKRYAERTGSKAPTITAIVAAATAAVLREHPQINGMIRWGRIYTRKKVSLFLQTAVDDEGKELSGLTIHEADKKSLDEIVAEVKSKALAIREDKDPNFKKTKSFMRSIPAFLMRWLLNTISFLTYTLNLDLSSVGIPRDAFGSVMITSIGTLGLDQAFAPLVPYSRVPLLLAVGAVKQSPVVVDGQLAIAPLFKICATFDHRFIDGIHAAKMGKAMRAHLETDDGLEAIGLR